MFRSTNEISSNFMTCYNEALKIGQLDSAMIALNLSVRFKMLGGCNLGLISKSFGEWLKLAVSRWALMDYVTLSIVPF